MATRSLVDLVNQRDAPTQPGRGRSAPTTAPAPRSQPGRTSAPTQGYTLKRPAKVNPKPESGGGGGGFFSDLGKNLGGLAGTVKDLPSGIVGLGRQAATTVVGVPRETIETAAGVVGLGDGGEWGVERGRSLKDNISGFGRATGPLVNELAAGVQRTGGRLVDQTAALAPGGKAAGEGAYAKAWREGQLGPILLEDVGNASLVGAGVAKGLGAAGRVSGSARLAGVAEKVAEVSRLGDQFGAAPAKPYLAAGRGINRLAEKATGRSLSTIVKEGAEAHAPAVLKPSVAAARNFLSERRFEADEPIMAAAEKQRALTDLVPDVEDQVALNLSRTSPQVVQQIVRAADQGADFGQLVGDAFPDQVAGYEVTPAAVARADAYLKRAPGEDWTRFDEAKAQLDKSGMVETYSALSGVGRKSGPLNPEQLGDDIRPSVVRAQQVKLDRGTGGLERAAFNESNRALSLRRQADAEFGATRADSPLEPGTPAIRHAGEAEGRARSAEVRAGRLTRLAEKRRLAISEVPEKLRATVQQKLDAQVDAVASTVRRLADEIDDPLLRDYIDTIPKGDTAYRFHAAGDLIAKLDGDPRLNATQQARLDRAFHGYQRQRSALLDSRWDASIEAAPARYRRSLIQGRRLAQSLVQQADELDARYGKGTGDVLRDAIDEIPTTVGQAAAAGIDPAYLHGGRVSQIAPPGRQGGSGGGSGRLTLPKSRGVSSEKLATSDVTAYDFASQTAAGAREAAQFVQNKAAEDFIARFGKKVTDITDDPNLVGRGLADAAAEQGLVATNFSGLFDKVSPDQVGRNSVFLPESMVEAFANYFEPKRGAFWEGLGTINRGFKKITLPFSVRWHTGNIVGGAVLAMGPGGVSPVELVRQLNEFRKDRDGYTGETPNRIRAAGVPVNDRLTLFDPLGQKQPGRLGRVVRKSYALNEFVDNMYRSAVYHAKVGQGLTEAEATKATLRAMGDFGRMTPTERKYVREVLPFYAWARTITTSMAKYPIYHPTRAIWTLHLADLYADDELPGFLAGAVPVGDDKAVNVGFLNPMGDLTAGTLTSPSGFASGLSPALKVPLETAFGVNANKGFAPLTSSQYGENPDPSLGLFAERTIRNVGLARNLRDVAQGPKVRYGSGEEIKSLKPTRTRANSLAGLIGLPLPENVDLEAERRKNRQRSS